MPKHVYKTKKYHKGPTMYQPEVKKNKFQKPFFSSHKQISVSLEINTRRYKP